MSVTAHIPSTRGRLGLTLAAAAGLWVLAYWVNGWIWDTVLHDWFAMAPDGRLTETLHFFLYDTIKILLLLVGIIFVVTFLRSFMSVERTRALLGGKREGVGNVMAAGLGVITPFCSCSAVPAFIGFVSAGVPIGVTLSFLIASPLANEIAIGLLWSLFGWKIALLYVAAGVTIAIVAGFILGKLHVERWVEPFVFQTTLRGQPIDPAAGLTIGPARDDGHRGGREHPAPYLALPAGRDRPRGDHPRLGPDRVLHHLRQLRQPVRRAGRRGDRCAAVLQRRRGSCRWWRCCTPRGCRSAQSSRS